MSADSTAGGGGGAPSLLHGLDAFVEPRRARLRSLAIALITFGCAGLVCAWAWFTCALAITVGALLLDTFTSRTRLDGKLSGKLACCGAPQQQRAHEGGACCGAPERPREDACCCAPYHTVGVTTAALVFACVDFTWSIVTLSAAGRDTWNYRVPVCTMPWSPFYRVNPCDDSFKRGLRYQVVAWALTFALSQLFIILLACVLTTYRELELKVPLLGHKWWATTRAAAVAAGAVVGAAPLPHEAVGAPVEAAYPPPPPQQQRFAPQMMPAPQLVYVVPPPRECAQERRR